HRLAERGGQARRDEPGGDVGDAAGREADDEPDGLGRVLGGRGQRQHAYKKAEPPKRHAARFEEAGVCTRGRTSFASSVIWSIASACERCPACAMRSRWPRPPTLSLKSAIWAETSSGVPTNMMAAFTRSSIAPWWVSTNLP